MIHQLELGLNGRITSLPAPRGQNRMARAAWWFAQMRATVQRAMDCNPASQPPPEQIVIPGAHRHICL
ncbi:MAG: hypothetical protein KGJ88_03680 [Verrucomicrobiota bacterium]|nr:hypothetical protein [Verrucomicrobiota bacterium]